MTERITFPPERSGWACPDCGRVTPHGMGHACPDRQGHIGPSQVARAPMVALVADNTKP